MWVLFWFLKGLIFCDFFGRRFVVPISTIFEKLLCGRRSLDAEDAAGVELGKPLPGSDAVEASRRRYTSHLSYCWLGICPSSRNVKRV
jgi:hypothetical protein